MMKALSPARAQVLALWKWLQGEGTHGAFSYFLDSNYILKCRTCGVAARQ